MRIDENGDPIWRDGDCVRIRFETKKKTDDDGKLLSNQAYTYIRSDGYWPGDAEWSTHEDDVMTAAWHDNRLSVQIMTDVKPAPDEVPPMVTELRIAKRRLDNIRDIIDHTSTDRPLRSFIAELEAVLG